MGVPVAVEVLVGTGEVVGVEVAVFEGVFVAVGGVPVEVGVCETVAVGLEVAEEVGVELLLEIGILGLPGADSSREQPTKNPKPTNPVKKVPQTKNRHDFIFSS